MFVLRLLYLTAGLLSLALGGLGIILPVLPTTPFVILAGFCFSKGSPRMHQWLRSLKGIGPLVVDWEDHGVIRRRGKIFATGAIGLLMVYPLVLEVIPGWVRISVVTLLCLVLAFIWTRPSVARERSGPFTGGAPHREPGRPVI